MKATTTTTKKVGKNRKQEQQKHTHTHTNTQRQYCTTRSNGVRVEGRVSNNKKNAVKARVDEERWESPSAKVGHVV
jgi:hypothetical protein